jgi:hypothetical protein
MQGMLGRCVMTGAPVELRIPRIDDIHNGPTALFAHDRDCLAAPGLRRPH